MPLLAFGSNETYQFDRDLYLAAGMTMTRTTLKWSLCEPVDGGGISFDVSPDISLGPMTYTEIVQQAAADGVTVILTITDPPAWAAGAGVNQINPAYYGRFQTFCQAAAVNFGTDAIYEPFNEVTSADFYWDATEYLTVLGYASAGLKAGNPATLVMHAGLVAPDSSPPQDLLKTLCTAPYKSYWDICSFHIYGAEFAVPLATAVYRGILVGHQLQSRPLWVTETASGTKDGSVIASPEHAAQDVVKRALDAYAQGASVYMWWPMSDAYLGSDNPAGLNPATKCMGLCWCPAKVELDLGAPYVSHARLSYTAFQTMVGKIDGFTSYREIARTVRQLVVDGGLVFVAWQGLGAMPTFRGPIRVTTHLGVVTEMDASALTLTDAPVYVELLIPTLPIPPGLPGEAHVASDTDIANIALTMLGKATIADISENDAINVCFPTVRDAVLCDHPWQFATRYETLNQDAEGTDSGWDLAYILPTEHPFLMALEVNDVPWFSSSCGSRFEISGSRLLTNETAVVLKYIWQVTSASLYDPIFVMALASGLAAAVAPNLAPTLVNVVQQKYAYWIQQAKGRDARQGTVSLQQNSTFRDARF